MAHAMFSPSSSKRVCSCPASLALHEDQGTSYDAALGTVAHGIHERVLLGELWDAAEAIGEHHVVEEGSAHFEFVVDVPMADAVQESVEFVRDVISEMRRDGEEPQLFVEVKADISRWTPIPDQFGTSDVVIIGKTKLVVIDYKHGSGIKVDAERNTQLALYALGSLAQYENLHAFEHIDMRIHQPRMLNYSRWEQSKQELLQFGDYIAERFELAVSGDAPFGPSEGACKFCSVKARCPALAKFTEKLLDGVFDDLDSAVAQAHPVLPDIRATAEAKLLPVDALGYLWKSKKLVMGYFEAVQEACERHLLHGEPIPDLKLVEGRGSREWTDETAARQMLEALGCKKSDVIKVVLVSPAQADDLLPKKKREPLQTLIRKLPGKPTVALASDKRKEWINPRDSAFDDLDADDTGL